MRTAERSEKKPDHRTRDGDDADRGAVREEAGPLNPDGDDADPAYVCWRVHTLLPGSHWIR